MIVAGVDIGSLTAKAVIMEDDTILAAHVMRVRPDPEESARDVMDQALSKAGIANDRIAYCIGTGYGRNHIPFAQAVESEIACHARGAHWHHKGIRTVVDIGGQDAKAIRLDETGTIQRYAYNDKCASGTGRFLEIMGAALGLDLETMGELSLASRSPATLSNQCVVFAETEIVSLVNDGRELSDIVSGLHKAMAHRVASLAKGIQMEPDVAFTGGVAKNPGMFKALEDALGVSIVRLDADPQINGALGAAILARQAASQAG
ncbi:MAG: acyl-CoA dehydratase activase [Syntrophaceae bacterium]